MKFNETTIRILVRKNYGECFDFYTEKLGLIPIWGDRNGPYTSFANSLFKEYRGLGIGTALMKEMLYLLKRRGYKQASLAAQKANYAVKLYKKVGFEIVDENEEEYIMVCYL